MWSRAAPSAAAPHLTDDSCNWLPEVFWVLIITIFRVILRTFFFWDFASTIVLVRDFAMRARLSRVDRRASRGVPFSGGAVLLALPRSFAVWVVANGQIYQPCPLSSSLYRGG